MLNILLLLSLLAIVPYDYLSGGTVVERCDLVEVNHLHDGCGQHVFDQVIFWDWSPRECRFTVRAWRMVKKPEQTPTYDWDRSVWSATWTESVAAPWTEVRMLREVRSDSFRETWTQYDPELVEREILPQERRRGLRPGGK